MRHEIDYDDPEATEELDALFEEIAQSDEWSFDAIAVNEPLPEYRLYHKDVRSFEVVIAPYAKECFASVYKADGYDTDNDEWLYFETHWGGGALKSLSKVVEQTRDNMEYVEAQTDPLSEYCEHPTLEGEVHARVVEESSSLWDIEKGDVEVYGFCARCDEEVRHLIKDGSEWTPV